MNAILQDYYIMFCAEHFDESAFTKWALNLDSKDLKQILEQYPKSKTIKMHIEVEVTVPVTVALEDVLETPLDYLDEFYDYKYLGADGYEL